MIGDLKSRDSAMKILGIHDGHNCSACLMVDGKIEFAAQEERYTRKKNEIGFPENTVKWILEHTGITADDIDLVAIASTTQGIADLKSKKERVYTVEDWWREMEEFWKPRLRGEEHDPKYRFHLTENDDRFGSDSDIYEYPEHLLNLDSEEQQEEFRKLRVKCIAKLTGISESRFEFFDHHSCHIHYGTFSNTKPDPRAIGVTIDAYGDGYNQTVWNIEGNRLELLDRSTECEIGRVFQYLTLLLGMKPLEHEYKVMGMAPYAKEKYIQRVIEVLDDVLVVDGVLVRHLNRPKDLFQHFREAFKTERFDNIAGGAQAWVEKIVSKLFRNIFEKYGVRSFVFSGGVAMNIKLNKVLSDLDCIDSLFVCGSSSDESLCIGACYAANLEAGRANLPLETLYLGETFEREEVLRILEERKIPDRFNVTRKVGPEAVAELLAKHEVVARIGGRTEFGARALGNRSILANPSNSDVIRVINEMIKGRDFWMPFALTVCDEYKEDYIVDRKGIEGRYMAMGFDTVEENRLQIKAGTHPYDFTVRPQILGKEQNPEYYAIISAFRDLTGIGALLNTSLNLHGFPLVRSAEDGLDVFENSGLNHLLIQDVLISRS